jgi:hypothetical protein
MQGISDIFGEVFKFQNHTQDLMFVVPYILVIYMFNSGPWKEGIYTAMKERDLKMGEWNNRRQWSMAAGKRRQTL